MHMKGLNGRLERAIQLISGCRTIDRIEVVSVEDSEIKFAAPANNAEVVKWFIDEFPSGPVSESARSLFHKHFVAMKSIASGDQPALIFEDDVLFDPSAVDKFVTLIDSIPSVWDFCFFGTGCGLSIGGSGFVKNNNQLKSKCTDSMLVHPDAARRIVDSIVDDCARLPIDWELNYRFLLLGMDVYWYEPGITSQGSQNGTFVSMIK